MTTVTIKQAKADLPKLIHKACRGEEVIIKHGSKPVVRLVPVETAPRPRGPRKPGALKGKIHYSPDAFDPLSPEELDEWGL